MSFLHAFTQRRRWMPDALAITILTLLCGIFFWRLFAPEADQISFKQGDFSGQFVAFAGYQYQRMAEGALPLWNPYNNGGFPFIADTQAAIFYPPRLASMAVAVATSSFSYHTLQVEAVLHMLAYSLMMYAFVRRLILGDASIFSALLASITATYSGFTTGYPLLQLAILEAGIWLPLVALGILEATRTSDIRWGWLSLAGAGLGISWLAGHPQTSWFLTAFAVAWLGWRGLHSGTSYLRLGIGLAVLALVSFGIAAIALVPGIEYLLRTTRADLGYSAKNNGFPFQDVMQLFYPGTVSLFSPMYIGIAPLIFIIFAVRQRATYFWSGLALVAFLLSFGGNGALYPALYNVIPGLKYFRGQERAVYLVVNCLAVMAALGMAQWLQNTQSGRWHPGRISQVLGAIIIGIAVLFFVAWVGFPEAYQANMSTIARSALIAGVLVLICRRWSSGPAAKGLAVALLAVLCFDLFSVNSAGNNVYDPVPYQQQLAWPEPPDLVASIQADDEPGWRVDGFRGLRDNYGSLYRIPDMRGISPLFLNSAYEIIYRNYIHNPLAWELFAVKYVFSEREQFGTPTQVIGQGIDHDGPVYLHEVLNPRPFAHLVYQADVLDSDAFARALLDDPAFRPRESVILNQTPPFELSSVRPAQQSVSILTLAPEYIEIHVDTPENAMLSLALVDYPGWQAYLNDAPTELYRAYGVTTAIAIPEGQHRLILQYRPLSLMIGGTLTILTSLLLILWTGYTGVRLSRRPIPVSIDKDLPSHSDA